MFIARLSLAQPLFARKAFQGEQGKKRHALAPKKHNKTNKIWVAPTSHIS
jgi:hypothetical protein